jgi:hypothetical protein
MRSKAPAQLLPIPHNKVGFTSQSFTFSETYLYKKGERALPGNFRNCDFFFVSNHKMYCIATYVSDFAYLSFAASEFYVL